MTKIKTEKEDNTIFYIDTYDRGWHEGEDRYDPDLFDTHYFKGKDAFDLAYGYMENCCEYLDITSSGRVHPKDVTESISKGADDYKVVEKKIKEAFGDYYEDDRYSANEIFTRIVTEKDMTQYKKYLPKAWLKEQKI